MRKYQSEDKPNNLYFFGGGKLLASIITELNSKKYKHDYKKYIFTSKRHSKEIIYNNLTFKKFLKINKVEFKIIDKITNQIKNNIKKNSVGVSFGSAWIFKADFIRLFKNRLYNVHGSDLPEDRGGGGFSWQILNGKKKLTSTIHYLKPGIDKGEIIYQDKYFIGNGLTPLSRQKIYEKKAKIFFMRNLKNLLKRKLKTKKQNENKASYWPRLNTQIHGWIDWKWTATEISKFILAFDDPYSGAKTMLGNNTIHLKKCFLKKSKTKFHSFQTGIIIRKNKNFISISCGNSVLNVKKILNKNHKKINIKKIRIGDRFYTPTAILEKALKTRVRLK